MLRIKHLQHLMNFKNASQSLYLNYLLSSRTHKTLCNSIFVSFANQKHPLFVNTSKQGIKKQKQQQLGYLEELQQCQEELENMMNTKNRSKQTNRQYNKNKNNVNKNYQQNGRNLQMFKIGAQKVSNFQQLMSLYRRNVDTQDLQKFFVVASINFSRIIRRFKSNQYHDVNLFLGQNYKIFSQINLNKLQIQQIAHIANLLNVIEHKLFINTLNPNLKQFVHQMCVKVIKELKYRRKQQKTGQLNAYQYRNKSIVCKILRTAQIFLQDQTYLYLMQYVRDNCEQLDLFEFLSIFNTLMRNNHNHQINKTQKQFINRVTEIFLERDWIKTCSIHSFCDLIGPIITITKLYPDIVQNNRLTYNKLWQTLQTFFMDNYQQLSGQEIIRILKLSYEINPNIKIIDKVIEFSINSIQAIQQTEKQSQKKYITKLDPIFIFRLLAHIRQKLILWKDDPQKQQKINALVVNYFIDQKNCPIPILESLNYLIKSGCFSEQFTHTMMSNIIELLDNTQINENQETMTYRNKIQFSLNSIKSSLQLFQLQKCHKLLNIINTEAKDKNTEVYFYYVYLQLISDFLRKNGCVCYPQRPKIFRQTGITKNQIKISKSQNPLGFLKQLFMYSAQIAKSGSRITRLNFTLLAANIACLKYTLKYNQFINAYKIIQRPSKNLAYKLYTSFLSLPLSLQTQKSLKHMLIRSHSKSQLVQICFNQTRNFRQTNLRIYTSQAQFLFDLIQQSQFKVKNYYSDIVCLKFMLRFLQSKSIQIMMGEISSFCTSKNSQIDILQVIAAHYQKSLIDCRQIRLIINTLMKQMSRLQQTFGDNYFQKQLYDKFQRILWINGQQLTKTIADIGSISTVDRQYVEINRDKSKSIIQKQSKILNLLTKISQQQYNENSIYILNKLLRNKQLKYALQLQSSNKQKICKTVQNIVNNIINQNNINISSQSNYSSKQQILLDLFISTSDCEIIIPHFFQFSIKNIQVQSVWSGYILAEDLFRAVDTYRQILLTECNSVDYEYVMGVKWVKTMVKLFWYNPSKLLKPLMQILTIFENTPILKSEIQNQKCYIYLLYLKFLKQNQSRQQSFNRNNLLANQTKNH